VEVPVLPPLRPVEIAQDRQLRTLFGSEDDNEDEVAKAPPTPTVAVPAADYYTLDANKPWNNADNNNDQSFTPFMMRVFCLFFLYLYDVTSNIELAMITGAHVLAKVKEAYNLFDPKKIDLRFHPGVSKTLTTFKPYVLLSQYGFTNPKKQPLSLFGWK
jgi:hypothetical protein